MKMYNYVLSLFVNITAVGVCVSAAIPVETNLWQRVILISLATLNLILANDSFKKINL